MKFIKAFILIICLFISCKCFAVKEFIPFKMVFLPDTHLSFSEEEGKVLYKESLVILHDVIKKLNKEQNLDFVVFGGNLTNNDDGKLSDMPMFIDSIITLNPKYYAILGDKEAKVKEEFIREFDEFTNKPYWSAEPIENVLLIGLDSTDLNIDQLFWLDGVLKSNMDKFTIIAMHHSPYTSMKKPDLFLQLLNMYPQVKLVLSGHDHTTLVKQEYNKLFMTFPSIVSYPNKYKILEIYPDRVKVKTKKISFQQIIKKAKKNRGKDYKKPDKFSRKSKYFF